MSRCLSDETLMRAVAELATPAERAHLAACPACGARRSRLEGELDGIRQVLVTTAEPRRLAAPSRRWSIAAMVTLSAAAVGALLWIEATAWKTLQPAPDAARAEQIAAVLADVSAALFSVDGEPALALAESPVATALGQGGDMDPVCDGPAWLADAECSGTLYGVEDPLDAIEMEAMERTVFDWNSFDQGG